MARPRNKIWTKETEALLGTNTDSAIAAQLQLDTALVFHHRKRLGIAPFQDNRITWTPEMDALLGTDMDPVIAAQLHVGVHAVHGRRNKLGIATPYPKIYVWTPETEKLLGTATDSVIAAKLGITLSQVSRRRHRLGLPAAKPRTELLKNVIAKAGNLIAPGELPTPITERQFFVDHKLIRRIGDSWPDTEDRELSAYLEQELAELFSVSTHPIACPRCDSRRTVLIGRVRVNQVRPNFRCKTCKRTFNRLTGTPFTKLQRTTLLLAFVRLLSQQIPYSEAARRLCIAIETVHRWAKQCRLWLLHLDPTGKWEARVLLGIKPQPIIRCPRCGIDGEKRFHSSGTYGRKLFCDHCRSTFSVHDAEHLMQQKIRVNVGYDPGKVALNTD